MDEIRRLTDEQLIARLKEFGDSAGPVTSSTRMIFERRLWKHLNPSKSNDSSMDNQYQIGVDSPRPPVSSVSRLEQPGSLERMEKKLQPTEDEKEPDVYYGVQLPLEIGDKDTCCVFINKVEALRFMKKHPGSRFKMFDARDKAERFSKRLTEILKSSSVSDMLKSSPKQNNINQSSPSSPAIQPVSEGSEFRSVKTQDLVKLRKFLETGDVDSAKHLVWSNPRYLITSGDTPTVLQEGFRYNALHVAAMRNQPKSAQLILDTIQDREFMRRLYPNEPPEARENRIQFLVDLYLNTPDKGNCECALHFACKFGHVDVVDVLTAFPQLDRQRKNKHGETPAEIICNRAKVQSLDIKEKIHELLGDRYFVPLWRSDDNSCTPHISSPWSPTVDCDSPSGNDPQGMGSPCSVNGTVPPNSPRESPMSVRAYAGPMSNIQAKMFRKNWMTPPSVSPKERKEIADVRRRDSEKGMERIGRTVARNMKVPWMEFWDFLGCYVDLSTEEGLLKLESHLHEQRESRRRHNELEDDLQAVAEKLNRLHLSSASPKLVLYLSNDSDLLPNEDSSVSKQTIGGQNKEDGDTDEKAPVMNLSARLDQSEKEEEEETDCCQQQQEPKQNEVITSRSDNAETNSTLSSNGLVLPDSNVNSDVVTNYELNLMQDFNMNSRSLRIDDHRSLPELSSEDDENSDDEGSIDSFHTAMDVDEDSDVESLFTPPQSFSPLPKAVTDGYFIYGCNPNKVDVDVLRALEGVFINADTCPCIHEWKQNLLSFQEEDRKRWGTPRHISVAKGNQYSHTPSRPCVSTPYRAYTPGSCMPGTYQYGSPAFTYRSPSLSLSSPGSVTDSDSSLNDSSGSMNNIRSNLMASFLSEK